MAKKLRSPGAPKDPERSAALKGNKNASKGGSTAGKHGARVGFGASAISGLPGAFLGGMAIGAAKRGDGAGRSHTRVVKGAATAGAMSGAIGGALYGAAIGGI